MRKIILSLGLLYSLSGLAQTQQVVDLSTGVINNSTTVMASGVNDDTWTVTSPSGTSSTPITCTLSAWANNPNSKWISPHVVSGTASSNGTIGTYTYKTTFTTNGCKVNNASVTFNAIGADNTFGNFKVNGHNYTISNCTNCFGTLTNTNIVIAPSDFISGTNTIEIQVNNASSFTGLNVNGNLTINYAADAVPSLIGSVSYCSPSPITFSGSANPATAASHTWTITETNSAGTPTGAYTWTSASIAGNPGIYTFPQNPTCNKYYKVTLTTYNACGTASTASRIIYYGCVPYANAGPDVTICNGGCATIGVINFTKYTTYSWSTGGNVIGNTQQITVCPTTTTTYTLTVTNTLSGCTSTDQVTVTVGSNDPTFTLQTQNTNVPSGYNIVCTPNGGTTAVGYAYSWVIDDMTSGSSVTANCWPSTSGFGGYVSNSYGSGAATLSSCTTPVSGVFQYNHTYKITRTSKNEICPWASWSTTFTVQPPPINKSNVSNTIIILEEKYENSDRVMSLENNIAKAVQLNIYPNPSKGMFTLDINNADKTNLEVFDMTGKKVKSIEIEKNTTQFQLDLTDFAKGIYFINVYNNDTKQSQKLVIE